MMSSMPWLRLGPKTTPVIVLAGRVGGEGKYILLKALCSIYTGEGLVLESLQKGIIH